MSNTAGQYLSRRRAGTVNLFPKAGIGFYGAPIGVNSTPVTIEENGSLAPTLFEFLTGETITAAENGWGFLSLLDKLDVTAR